MSMKMEEFKLCSDGEFMPVSFPCPPPYSGPYYYYPYENIPLPPADQGNTASAGSSTNTASTKGSGSPISSGVVAGIIIIVGLIFFMLCLIVWKFRRRFILGRNPRTPDQHAGESHLNISGDMLVHIAGNGLEEKLVNLLPVCEYVGFMQEGKTDGKLERHECAVCLSLFEEKEIVRVLPKCKHTFHLQCIDKWFESHANCPLCRERITLQAIQLSFIADSLDHHQPLLGPAIHQDLTLDNQNNSDLNDQHVNAPQSRHACLQNVHDQQNQSPACGLQDPFPHQNIFLAAAPATYINNPPTTEAYQYQNDDQPVTDAAGGHLVNDQKSTGFTCRLQGNCDQNYKNDAESKEEKNAAREAGAHYNIDAQSAGPACGLQSSYDHPNPLAMNDQSQHGDGAAEDRTARLQSQEEAHAVDIDR